MLEPNRVCTFSELHDVQHTDIFSVPPRDLSQLTYIAPWVVWPEPGVDSLKSLIGTTIFVDTEHADLTWSFTGEVLWNCYLGEEGEGGR